MAITIEAVYENGVLKPAQPLPLREHEQVRVTVHLTADVKAPSGAIQRGHGLSRWAGPLEDLDHLIDDDENDPLEGP
jgi:predicted DNA-binding antitoxin AbrB/MazE fold protein